MPSCKQHRSSSDSRVAKGRKYEGLAAEFYQRNGFQILARNWRDRSREIDLVVRKDRLIVFVEVKSAWSEAYGHPAERMDRRKIDRLVQAARRFLVEHAIDDCDVRFDLVTFTRGRFEHYPAAFSAEE